jgi:hypothetical protein
MKILKKGRGSREKGGGGNEIHAPCACDFFPDARTFHSIYKLQKQVLLRHQSYLIVFMGNKIYDFGR